MRCSGWYLEFTIGCRPSLEVVIRLSAAAD
jgi:hypothetical protein